MVRVNTIDSKSFLQDLIYYKNISLEDDYETAQHDNNLNNSDDNNNDIELDLEQNNSENSFDNSFEMEDNEHNYIKVKGIIKAINYLIKYSKIKEGGKSEKFFILFTDIINLQFGNEYQLERIMENLEGDKEVIFLLVGKIQKNVYKKEINDSIESDKILEDLILIKFGEKSETIDFQNMKKIKTILSKNKVIKDEIFFPNEIYK